MHSLTGLTLLGLIIGLWALSLTLSNSSIVDIFWGAGSVATAWLAFALTPQALLPRKILLAMLVKIWGLRLSIHIPTRNWRNPVDFRYRTWRDEAGDAWCWQSFFKVFLAQGWLLWIIAALVVAAQAAAAPDHLTLLDGLAITVRLIGFLFEAAGDWQLGRFPADPANRGKLLNSGVWRLSRHPNYSYDMAQWWAYLLLAASTRRDLGRSSAQLP